MNQLQKQKENKSGILEDMLSFITYIPNRELDILAFMEQYQKADPECRPLILEHLRSCMDGTEYPNPYLERQHYTQDEVKRCGEILDEFIDSLIAVQGDAGAAALCVEEVVGKLNNLNEECNHSLIDKWRRERLCNFINVAAEMAGLMQESAPAFTHRM